ncbi:MAG: TonB-dependent receptor [Opitutaceae bacterium]|nr:TonB-dependent receptor [Opitutaceae bacterium]
MGFGISAAAADTTTAATAPATSATVAAAAPATIQGRVLNAGTGDYIYQARVRVFPAVPAAPAAAPRPLAETLTDSEGRYYFSRVPLPAGAGAVTIEATFTGMAPVAATITVAPGQDTEAPVLNLSMAAPSPPRAASAATGPLAPTSAGAAAASPAGTPGDDEKIVMLDTFVVESRRDLTGAAIAVNSQRFADNIRNVVSIEEMGFTGDGSITGALKFLPGVELENDDSGFGNAITLSGAPSANVPVTIGGLDAISSSYLAQNSYGNENQRSVNLMQLSANNISRVEVNRSPTPDSPGSALAGSVNLVPKSAFERARPQYTLQLFGSANARTITLSQRSAPLNGTQTPVHAGAALSAIVPLNKRLGFSLNLTHSVSPKSNSAVTRSVTANYNSLDEHSSGWGYLNNDPATGRVYKYYLHAFDLTDNNSTYTRDSVNLTVDYKLTRNSTLSLGWTQSYNEQQAGQHRASWDMGRARINWAASTTGDEWTGAPADRVTNTPASLHDDGTSVLNATTYNDFIDKNRQFSLKYRWRTHDWAAEFLASRGDAGRTSVDLSRDLLFGGWSVVDTVNITFAGIQEWDIGSITATHNGVPVSPFDLASLYSAEGAAGVRAETATLNTTRDTIAYTSLPRFRIKPDWTGDRKLQLAGSLSHALDIARTYHTAKLGFDYSDWKRDQRYDEAFGTGGGFYYDGIDVPHTAFISDGYNRALPLGYGVLPGMDLHQMALFYKAHPEMFKSLNPGNDYVTAVTNNKFFRETITSAYLRVDSSFLDHRLLLVWGLRAERTDDEAEGARVDPSANRALNPATGLMDYIYPRNSLAAARLVYTPRAMRAEKNYTSLFPSVNARYNLTANLVARASYSQTIGRPDVYNIVPGVVSNLVAVSSGDMAIRVTNPGLDPWKSRNLSLSLELYSDKIGDLTLRAYRRWINDAYADRTLSVDDSRDIIEFYGLDLSEFPNAYLVRPERIPGTLVTSGLELSGRYNLDPLLPSWARGLRVRFNISRSTITGGDELAASFGAQKMYLFPWSAGGSLTLERKYFTIAVSGKWNDTQRRAYYAVEIGAANGRYAPGTYEYIQPTFRLDLDLTVKLTRRLSLFINGRDINNYTQEHLRYAPDTPEFLKTYRRLHYEAVWTAGMKAVF